MAAKRSHWAPWICRFGLAWSVWGYQKRHIHRLPSADHLSSQEVQFRAPNCSGSNCHSWFANWAWDCFFVPQFLVYDPSRANWGTVVRQEGQKDSDLLWCLKLHWKPQLIIDDWLLYSVDCLFSLPLNYYWHFVEFGWAWVATYDSNLWRCLKRRQLQYYFLLLEKLLTHWIQFQIGLQNSNQKGKRNIRKRTFGLKREKLKLQFEWNDKKYEPFDYRSLLLMGVVLLVDWLCRRIDTSVWPSFSKLGPVVQNAFPIFGLENKCFCFIYIPQ